MPCTRRRGTVAAMLARVTTFAIDGLDPRQVTVEVDVRAGLPSFTIVGLADRAVREARERVRAAILNSGFEFPGKRLTVNLAPGLAAQGGAALRPGDRLRHPRGRRAGPGRAPRPAGGVRRAVARRRAAAVPGRARRGGGCRAPGRRAAARPGRPRRARRRSSRRSTSSARRRCARSPRSCAGRAPARRRPTTTPGAEPAGAPDLDLADVRGHGDVLARPDDRRRRRPQPAAERAAGHRARRCSPGACRRSCRR